jgi:alanine racemase
MNETRELGATHRLDELSARISRDAPGVVLIKLDRIAANWRALKSMVAPADCAPVVKADAYGLGAAKVIPTLARAGANKFFVATLKEASETLALAPSSTVYVLDGLLPGTARDMAETGAIPVLSSLPEVMEWAAVAPSRNEPVPCVLHVDTGLNRLGLTARDIHALANDMHTLHRLDVRLVMSHLACADEPAHVMNAQQLSVFRQLQPLLPSAPLSLAASDGLMLGPEHHFDLVRPGYALYGGQAFPGRITPVKPVVEVYARVLQIRELAPGQTVGYSATFTADRVTRIAVVAAGYADGILRHLSAGSGERHGHVAFAGRLCPVVGRVSMDLITVDITDLEAHSPERGDWAEIIGPTITIEDVGAAAGTIGYEVLTRLSPRFPRLHLEGPAASTET